MKKNKLYFIIPIVALVIFSAYYWNFSSQYEAQEAAKVAAQKVIKQQKLEAEAVAREAAIHDALEAQKVRKAERIARDAKERQMKDDKENARLGEEKADQEAQKLERQSEKLAKDVETTKAEIAVIEAAKKRSTEELGFVKQYTAAAKENQQKLADVLAKIQEADAAVARAAAAAAAAAVAAKHR
jgi:signal transduction histidine kinase